MAGPARGDRRYSLSAALRLRVTLSSVRWLSSALDRLQHLPQFPERRRLGCNLESLHMDLREDMDRGASPTAAIIDSRSVKPSEKATSLGVRPRKVESRESLVIRWPHQFAGGFNVDA